MSKVAEEAGWPESNLKNIWKTYEALYCTVSGGTNALCYMVSGAWTVCTVC